MIQESQLQKAPVWQTRDDLPYILNQLGLYGLGAEVGVQRGIFSTHIRSIWNGERLLCIDPWVPYYGVRNDAAAHEQYRQEAIGTLTGTGKAFTIMRMTALEAAAQLAREGAQFDFVFLDGDHDYQPLKEELEVYWPLIKAGGILAGHDYITDGWHNDEEPFEAHETEAQCRQGQHCGPFYVRKAVHEFFPEAMVSATSPATDRGWQSWMVRKAA